MGNTGSHGLSGQYGQIGNVTTIDTQNTTGVSCREVEREISYLNPQQGFLSYFRRVDPFSIGEQRNTALVKLEEYSNYLKGIIDQITSNTPQITNSAPPPIQQSSFAAAEPVQTQPNNTVPIEQIDGPVSTEGVPTGGKKKKKRTKKKKIQNDVLSQIKKTKKTKIKKVEDDPF